MSVHSVFTARAAWSLTSALDTLIRWTRSLSSLCSSSSSSTDLAGAAAAAAAAAADTAADHHHAASVSQGCSDSLGVSWIAVAEKNGFALSEDSRKHINSVWLPTAHRGHALKRSLGKKRV